MKLWPSDAFIATGAFDTSTSLRVARPATLGRPKDSTERGARRDRPTETTSTPPRPSFRALLYDAAVAFTRVRDPVQRSTAAVGNGHPWADEVPASVPSKPTCAEITALYAANGTRGTALPVGGDDGVKVDLAGHEPRDTSGSASPRETARRRLRASIAPPPLESGAPTNGLELAAEDASPPPPSVREPLDDIEKAVRALDDALSEPSDDAASERSLRTAASAAVATALARLEPIAAGAFALAADGGISVESRRLSEALRTAGSTIACVLREGLGNDLLVVLAGSDDANAPSRLRETASAPELPRCEAFEVHLRDSQIRVVADASKSPNDARPKAFMVMHAKRAYAHQNLAAPHDPLRPAKVCAR